MYTTLACRERPRVTLGAGATKAQTAGIVRRSTEVLTIMVFGQEMVGEKSLLAWKKGEGGRW